MIIIWKTVLKKSDLTPKDLIQKIKGEQERLDTFICPFDLQKIKADPEMNAKFSPLRSCKDQLERILRKTQRLTNKNKKIRLGEEESLDSLYEKFEEISKKITLLTETIKQDLIGCLDVYPKKPPEKLPENTDMFKKFSNILAKEFYINPKIAFCTIQQLQKEVTRTALLTPKEKENFYKAVKNYTEGKTIKYNTENGRSSIQIGKITISFYAGRMQCSINDNKGTQKKK